MNVAVIGCGNIANNAHIPAYMNNPDADILYFCDILPERARAACEKYGCGRAITDSREALADHRLQSRFLRRAAARLHQRSLGVLGIRRAGEADFTDIGLRLVRKVILQPRRPAHHNGQSARHLGIERAGMAAFETGQPLDICDSRRGRHSGRL